MGESIAEGTITRWLVSVGDTVERDQPLFEISTDKVDAEIPSPESGVLLKVMRGEGETVPVDEVVAILGAEGEKIDAGPEVQTAAQARESDEAGPEAEPESESESESRPQAPEEDGPSPAARPRDEGGESDTGGSADAALRERIRTHSSPVVRKMAAEAGVNISSLTGTGIHGRVTKADLERYLDEGAEAAPRETAAASATPAESDKRAEPAKRAEPERRAEPGKRAEPETRREPEKAEAVAAAGTSGPPAPTSRPSRREPGEFHVAAYGSDENVRIEPMSKIREITAAHMVYSKATSAHVTTAFHIDMSRVARVRDRAKDGFYASLGTKLTYMPFIFRAVANALKTNPKLNAAIDGTNVVFKKDINLGMAVALDWGLLVPVIRNADQLSLVGLAKRANDLADRARAKKLSPDEIRGGTFTITNPGVFGSLWGTPVINQPQVGILGIGVIEKRPIVDTDAEGNDVISIKTMSYFSITYDHRLVDGADADEFMNDVKHTLTNESWNELDPYL
jgi:2-oxoglutarate dehydrogenase E2 component (dihydrolipoamide succinyltransferase)